MKSAFMRLMPLSFLFVFFIPSFTSAEIKTFVKEYTYQASELDSKNTCKAIATEQLKRELLEELGTYVESKTVVKNYQLDKDEITTLTGGVVQVNVLNEKWNGKEYWLKAEVKADPDDVAASINKIRNDEHLAHELEEARAEAAQAMEEAEALRGQLAQAAADKQKQDQYNEAIDHLAASDYFQRGTAFGVAGNYEEAGRAYGQAIILQPEYAKAYINRSIVYVQLGRYDSAASDLKMAAALEPARQDTYYKRLAVQKGIRDLRIARTQKNRPPIQGRASDPLQKLFDQRNQERRKAALSGAQGRPGYPYAESSKQSGAQGSYNKGAGALRPGLVSKGEGQNQALRKERELRRKQRVEEIRKNRVMKRQERRKVPEREKEIYRDRR